MFFRAAIAVLSMFVGLGFLAPFAFFLGDDESENPPSESGLETMCESNETLTIHGLTLGPDDEPLRIDGNCEVTLTQASLHGDDIVVVGGNATLVVTDSQIVAGPSGNAVVVEDNASVRMLDSWLQGETKVADNGTFSSIVFE